MSVKFPGGAFAADGDDLSAPTQALLRDLRLLELKDDVATLWTTPPTLQLITSGATALSKAWAAIVALAGSAGAVGAAILGASEDQPVLVAASGLVGAAGLIAAAIIARADVDARAKAASAEYLARGKVAATFMTNCYVGRPQIPETRYWLRVKDARGRINPEWKPVEKLESDGTELVAVLGNGGGRILSQNIGEWQTRP